RPRPGLLPQQHRPTRTPEHPPTQRHHLRHLLVPLRAPKPHKLPHQAHKASNHRHPVPHNLHPPTPKTPIRMHPSPHPSKSAPPHHHPPAMHRSIAGIATITIATAVTIAVSPTAAFADEVRDNQWYLDSLGINDAHELSQGEGITIGVIDTGIDATHPDLKDNVEAGKDYGTSTGDGLNDPDGHGTSTTSILAGHGHGDNNNDGIVGIAPKATVVSVGLDCEGRCA